MRILIVDDEVIIRTGLCTVIDWKELGLELLPAASSAEEALERIPVEKPHIVLTDIRMSGMDGIELAREVKVLLPDTEIVILTGYDDFSYAQQALREGVTDYLLKTSRPEEIIKAALKAKMNIMEKWESVKQDMMQQAALRSQLLDRVLSRGLQDDEIAKEQLQVWFHKYGVDVDPVSGLPAPMQVLLIAASGWGESPITELLQGAAENILFELLPCVTLMKKDHLLMVVRHEAGFTDQAGLIKALKRVTDTLKCSAFAAMGTVAPDYETLRESYRAAKEVFAYQGLIGSKGLFTLDDIRERSGGRTVCTEKEEAELTAILMSDNATELRHWVNQKVRALMEDTVATPLTVHGYLQSMIIAGHRWLERACSAQNGTASLSTLPTYEGEGRPEDEVFKVLSAVMSRFHQGLDQNRYAYVYKSIAYIRDNLHQPISLQQVAGFVHVNPNHFSEVFKRETGCTYIEFVTQERMKRAIDILQGTQTKVSDIARRVGYEDIKYFTQQFKKYTGKTPSEFRQGGKTE
ncbi:response regulator [Paenibacillus sp. HWE-109]|uniref:response regulator transcription factor n=1 Tax=Paenibacillus sp. HWE-109 TaxID=1306526 RepID=UPI001EE09EE6|nr:response regulator [Paenibacillus sp. HWE-109]UKS26752.1 response regulator [Paenibacillus sp. HWE-109]